MHATITPRRSSPARRDASPARGRRGLTLVELVVVILILGILGALATPRFMDAVQGARLKAAARSVRSDLEYLRDCAINRGRSVEVQFDAAGDRYVSPAVDHPDRPGRALAVDVKERFDPAIELSADFAGQPTVMFDLSGVPRVEGDAIASGRVVLSLGNHSLTVVVRASGRVEPASAAPAGG